MAHRILIVDDDQIFNNLLTDVFKQAGYDVHSAHAADEALAMLDRDPFDLIVTDQRMPGKLGTEFVRDVLKSHPAVPVVMVSGYLENETIRELIRSGVEGVFIKPLNIFQLLKRASQLLARHDKAKAQAAGEQIDPAAAISSGGIRSFPGRMPRSTQFARRLEEVSDFSTNLLLVGNDGTDFQTICEDLRNMGSSSEELLFLPAESVEKQVILDRIKEAGDRGAAMVTVVVTEPEKLDSEQAALLIRLARRHSPFDDVSLLTRFVFCLRQDLDTLYDQELVDESLYLFMGTNELKAPSLSDVRDDVPLMAQTILALQDGSGARLDPEAGAWLREQNWPGDALQLTKVVREAAAAAKGSLLTVLHLRNAYQGRKPAGAGDAPQVGLREYLKASRDQYVRAALILCGSDRSRAAASLGAPRELVDRLAN